MNARVFSAAAFSLALLTLQPSARANPVRGPAAGRSVGQRLGRLARRTYLGAASTVSPRARVRAAQMDVERAEEEHQSALSRQERARAEFGDRYETLRAQRAEAQRQVDEHNGSTRNGPDDWQLTHTAPLLLEATDAEWQTLRGRIEGVRVQRVEIGRRGLAVYGALIAAFSALRASYFPDPTIGELALHSVVLAGGVSAGLYLTRDFWSRRAESPVVGGVVDTERNLLRARARLSDAQTRLRLEEP